MAQIVKAYFDNSNLNQDFEYTYNHGKGTINVICSWYDENGIDRTTTDTFRVIDDDNVLVSCGGPLTGLQEIVMVYDNSVNITGRRLFELNLASGLTMDYRIALGKANYPAQNMTLATFTDSISNNLLTYFYKVSNNLSEIATAGSTAQALAADHLSVYSKSNMNTIMDGKVDKSSAVSQLNSNSLSTIYEPNGDYNLATKKYVDSKIVIMKESTFTGSIDSTLSNRSVIGRVHDFSPSSQSSKSYSFEIRFTGSSNSTTFKELGTLTNFTTSLSFITRTFIARKVENNQLQDAIIEIRQGGKVWVKTGSSGDFISNVNFLI